MPLGRNLPQPQSRKPRADAYLAGILAFLSTVYVLLNRTPLAAALIVAAFWIVGIILYSILRNDRWRLVLVYLSERRDLMRKLEQPISVQEQAAMLDAKDAEISPEDQDAFTKLMREAGFSSKWPE